MKFFALPNEIDAIQFTGADNFYQLREFFGLPMILDKIHEIVEIRIPDATEPLDKFTTVFVCKGDWVFRGPTGKLTAMSYADFQATYGQSGGEVS